ncbi:deoxyribose-phosphate aldolase [Siansivirga zeaxanthinifaciens]|uniref:Deoxyribose-phosphate aldolase n=1 Tax=Siansivirga zeaxanthinifaciens CC-SAMT-1 TaxID=1454006 RepID=A0A0C5VYG2_9FLAO|nr:deoxyribose-phosphate aldolase [Siansivirga zeaxanthinifaciens]AJR04111.1 deoxyribose-phosphate aldolase [Siansivirga zeaxanthinifaciens CC-SAMT-1]
MEISRNIDYTLLKATSTERDIIDFCHEAITNNFYAVCLNSCYVALAKQLLKNTDIKIATVVGFPLGAMSTEAKIFEAKKAIDDGADEIETVINLGLLKSHNYVSVLRDLNDLKLAIGDTPLKVIIEISELSKNEIVKACEICTDANVDYVKTSSGFSKRGATLTAIKIIKKTLKNKAKIQASGSINNSEIALKYLETGVHRISYEAKMKKTKSARKFV